ncbi:MAG: SUMF1/EgtB/PvdO family nonheme iron enzyme [Pseudomonadota bacterium]
MTLKKEEAERQLVQLQEAATYLQIAADSYAYDTARLAVEEAELQGDIELARQTLTFIERDITTQESQQAEAIAAEEARLAAAEASRIRDERYRELRTELRRVLRCKGDISDPDLTSLGQVLREKKAIYPSQYAADESGIVEALRGCVQQRIASRDPERARIVKSTVVGFLPDRTELANIQIEDLDPCGDRRLVGQGNKNLAWCRDKLFEGYGPELVVIPRPVGTETRYAISRVEIKVSDYNHFCQATGCAGKTDQSNLPVTDISFDDANAYAAWLSEQTGKVYRIPTLKEWLHAVRTDVVQEIDDNVNCSVNSRGVQLGDTLRGTTTGRPNRWGLFNYVGNAREWVVDDDVLFAAGGAHTDPMSECTIDQRISHGGEPDAITGFRLLRELKVRGG